MATVTSTTTTAAPTLLSKSLDTATVVASAGYSVVSPFVPLVVKTNVVAPAAEYATDVKGRVVARGVFPAAVSVAADAKLYAKTYASSLSASASGRLSSLSASASDSLNSTITTVSAYTPSPILALIAELSRAARDPVAALKPYVPAFVVHTGERTYEIVAHNIELTKESVSATTGFLVSKVNGSVEYVAAIPQVHLVIEKLNAVAAPVISKIASSPVLGKITAVTTTAPATLSKAAVVPK
ncbi:hypothetical protein HK100_000094 [Physocladia obscura]|uniref:Rubber elongation factor n=1 Tax=Physocladia obscura TaxID=109957 RepID=A0AAD5XFU9_9FUNG|nr:hypothetical protein HK100_000094 [Physocladia obscura]